MSDAAPTDPYIAMKRLPAGATVSRSLLESIVIAQTDHGTYDVNLVVPAIATALVNLELELKGLDLLGG